MVREQIFVHINRNRPTGVRVSRLFGVGWLVVIYVIIVSSKIERGKDVLVCVVGQDWWYHMEGPRRLLFGLYFDTLHL